MAKPVIDASCRFFECRATIADTFGQPANGEEGGGPIMPHGCGHKADEGNYTMLYVQPPDESAGIVNSSA